MEIVSILLSVIGWMTYIYLTFTALYLFVFSFASLFRVPTLKVANIPHRKIAILIPCYQEDEIILEVAKEALNQDYPKELFDIVIIADNFQSDTIEKLQKLPLILFNEKFPISTKTRALNHALKHLPQNKYDLVCILDADNIMEPDFLAKMNQALHQDCVAVQGHRIAKNLNTPFAILDAISEEINNNIFRKGHIRLGLSSALIGSAMLFDYHFFKDLMADIEVVGGFDKEIELRLMRDGYRINYLPDAYVYDEKVQNAKAFSRQRRRWLSAQFHYFGIHFIPALKAFFKKGNIEYLNKALQYLQLPRILTLGLLFLIALLHLFLSTSEMTILWLSSLIIIILALLLAIPSTFYKKETLKAILYLPVGFLFMLLSLLKIKGANERFIHTKHTFNAFQIKKKK